jgi:hypothetical protein
MPISLEKVQQSAPALVNLYKDAGAALESAGITSKAKVALVLDFSGSMSRLYSSGFVQQVAEKVLSLGLRFDDDGDIEVFLFDSGAAYAGALSLTDYQGGVDRLTSGRRMGSTNYAAAIEAVVAHYSPKGKLFSRKASAMTDPVYVAFFTDGEPDSRSRAKDALRDASDKGIFFQFVGLGDQEFDFLQKLDTLSGRALDNAGFFSVSPQEISNPDASNEVLYDYMLKEFAGWIPQAQAKGYIA